MKEQYLKGTATFMIALILMIPIYSSSAFAVLSKGTVTGRDDVKGYIRRNEEVTLEVTAWISEDKENDDVVSASQVHLRNLQGPIFKECTPDGESFICTYETNSRDFTSNPYQIRVALYDDHQIFDDMEIIQVAFDELAPEIKSFTITPNIIGSGDLRFSYDIYDHSYSPTDLNRCSGLDKVTLSYDDTQFYEKDFNSSSNDCSRIEALNIPLSEVTGLEEGPATITLTAYDKFNHQSTASAEFEYDTQHARIYEDSLEVRDNDGNIIEYIGDNKVRGTISFIVISSDLNPDKVYGDISRINTNGIPSYSKKQASCIHYEEGFMCSFEDIEIRLDQSSSGSIPITIKAYDMADNMEPYTISAGITHDTTGPSVRYIRTDREDTTIAGGSTTFIVELDERDVGIDKNSITLDLSEIRSGLVKKADECTNSNNIWTCYWNSITADQRDGEKTITVSGHDLLGNPITGTASQAIKLDNTPPRLISAEIETVGVLNEAIEGYTKTGDSLDITLTVEEAENLRAYVDLSYFVTTEDNESTSCRSDGDIWTCDIRSSAIDAPGHRLGNIYFNLIDSAGNSIQYSENLEVLEYEDAEDISYWTSKVRCSPILIDRQVTNLVNTRIYCGVELETTGNIDQETLSIDFDMGDCLDVYNNSLDYVENIEAVNKERGSTEPYLAIDLIQGDMTINWLSFTCPLKIITRSGTKINENPELEYIDVDVNFYNMPLGEYGKGIESKIKEAKDDATEGIWSIIGFLKQVFNWARLICNSLAALQKVKQVLQVLTKGVTTAHLSAMGPPTEPIFAAVKTGSCAGDQTMGELSKKSYIIGDKYCKWINCQTAPPEQTNTKTTKGTGEFGEIASSIGEGHWFDQYMDWTISLPTGGSGNTWATGTISEVTGKQYYQYANARDNLLVAIVTGCIQGIINGLDKLRQIKCLYADCLEQNSVNNVPVKVCEDQKAYATCKYIFGEIFAFLPWTALFDYYTNMIKGALSDPISAIVSIFNVWLKPCTPRCDPSKEASAEWMKNEGVCRFLQFFSLLGEVINDVNGIINDYDQIKTDYCKRID